MALSMLWSTLVALILVVGTCSMFFLCSLTGLASAASMQALLQYFTLKTE